MLHLHLSQTVPFVPWDFYSASTLRKKKFLFGLRPSSVRMEVGLAGDRTHTCKVKANETKEPCVSTCKLHSPGFLP